MPKLTSQIVTNRHGSTAVLRVSGELDIARSPRFGVAISEALRTSPAALVIDLCDTDFVDSTGLAVLLNAKRRTLRQGVPLTVACDVPNTLRLLQTTRLDREFDVYPTADAAIDGARRQAGRRAVPIRRAGLAAMVDANPA